MTEHLKCKYCHKPLTYTDSVFIKVTRYDEFGRSIKKLVFCTNCWNHTTHFTHSVKVTSDDIKKLDNTDSFDKYYHLNDMPDPECIVKPKDNTCGACHHLIFKDYKHREGLCNLYRLHCCFDDRCKYEEEMS